MFYYLQAGPLLSSFDYKTGQHDADLRTEQLVCTSMYLIICVSAYVHMCVVFPMLVCFLIATSIWHMILCILAYTCSTVSWPCVCVV